MNAGDTIRAAVSEFEGKLQAAERALEKLRTLLNVNNHLCLDIILCDEICEETLAIIRRPCVNT